jgi:Uma2 family endonuclease
MTELPKRTDFTADEFIAWALEQPEGRFELTGGEIVAMAPERVVHIRVKTRVRNALEAALLANGLDCEAIGDGMAVRVDDRTVYEPDALVRCGPPLPGDAVEMSDPVIVVEAISPSSSRIDSGAKLGGYMQMPSVQHYLVVDPSRALIVHHRRAASGSIDSRIHREGAIPLDPPGIVVEVADFLPAV